MIYDKKLNKNNVSRLLQSLKLDKKYIDRIYYHKEAIAIDVNKECSVENRYSNVHVFTQSKYSPQKHRLIYESIIDPKQQQLDKDIWTDDNKLHKSVKDTIMSDIDDMIKNDILKQDQVKEILLLGSITTYNYTKDSDIDVNVSVEMSDEELAEAKQFLNEYNGKNAPGTTHPINYFFKNSPIELMDRSAYNIRTDEWISDPDETDVSIDNFRIIVEEAISWCRKIDLDIGELRRDFLEYLMYEYLVKENGNSEAFEDALQDKENEVKAGLDSLKINLISIKELRNKAFEGDDYELLMNNTNIISPDYNTKNIIYKIIERYGYLDMLHDAKKIHQNAVDGKNIKNDLIKFLKIDEKGDQ